MHAPMAKKRPDSGRSVISPLLRFFTLTPPSRPCNKIGAKGQVNNPRQPSEGP